MNGYIHLLIAICFIAGTFLIDFDHFTSCSVKQMIGEFKGIESGCERGILHNPIILYCLIALTLGLFIHYKMDGVL